MAIASTIQIGTCAKVRRWSRLPSHPLQLASGARLLDIPAMPDDAALLPTTVQPPTLLWADPAAATSPDLQAMLCPNCGASAPKSLMLTVDVQLPDNPSKQLRVLRCPACTCHFYDSQVPPDYAEPALNNRGRVPFYVQQGAGVSLITRPLAQAASPAGSAYMEVGCGYGFGLDFALNTRGWQGVGIDPAPLAALGRDALQLPIELRYLRDDDEARGTRDIVMGSEVVEHVTSPAAFVRTLRAMLKPGGLLILTTPNGDDIEPASPPGIIIPLLSPSLHLVIQNTTSLTALLHQAGFAHVDVQVDSHSLVAFASDAPLVLERDHDRLRKTYRAHLARRAAVSDRHSDVFLGFCGRAFQESVNDSDLDAAADAWALLLPACRERFGLDLDHMDALPPAVATCGLEEMARLVPLNLGGLLYARGIQRLSGGVARPGLESQFSLAAAAAAAMRRALNELAMEDGQTEDIGWTAAAEALLCAAAGGARDIAARLAALPWAPAGGAGRRRAMLGRALGNLVNAGHYDLARDVVQREDLASVAGDSPMTDSERDLVFSLAVLEVQAGPDGRPLGNPSAARRGFSKVRASAAPDTGLWWAALHGEMQALDLAPSTDDTVALVREVLVSHPNREFARWTLPRLVNAGQYDLAQLMVQTCALDEPALGQPLTDQDRDVVFSLAVLGLQAGSQEPEGLAAVQARFARVRDATAPGSDLWWAALRGSLQAMDRTGDGAKAAALLAAIVKAHPSIELGFPEMIHLVNAGQHDAARLVVRRSRLDSASFARPGSTVPLNDTGRDCLFFLAILDAQIGPDGRAAGEPAMGRARFARVRAVAPRGSDLWWAALRGELQSLDLLDAQDEAAALTGEIRAEHPDLTLPDDIAARIATPSAEDGAETRRPRHI